MGDILSATRTRLLAQSSISDDIGTRVYPDQLPQSAILPAVTLHRISSSHEHEIDGSEDGITRTRITVLVFADTREKADEIAGNIRKDGLVGWYGNTHGDVFIQSVNVDAGISHYADQNTEGSHELRYVTEQDYAILFNEET